MKVIKKILSLLIVVTLVASCFSAVVSAEPVVELGVLLDENYNDGQVGGWTHLRAATGTLANSGGALSFALNTGGSGNPTIEVATRPLNGGAGYSFTGRKFIIETRLKQSNPAKGLCFKINSNASGATFVFDAGFSLFKIINNQILPGSSVGGTNWGEWGAAVTTSLDTSDWLDVVIELEGDPTGATQAYGTATFTDVNSATQVVNFRHAYLPGINALKSIDIHTPIYDSSNTMYVDYLKIKQVVTLTGATVTPVIATEDNIEVTLTSEVAELEDISAYIDLYNGETLVPSVKTWDGTNKKVIINPDAPLNPLDEDNYAVKINKEALLAANYNYTGTPLAFNFQIVPCTAGNVTISGDLAEGTTITGSYTYSSQVPEEGSIYRWYKASSEAGPWTEILGLETVSVFDDGAGNKVVGTTVTADMADNKFVKFEVTPNCAAGPGAAVASTNILYPEKAPIVSELGINKDDLYINQLVKALYGYYDENGDEEDGSEIIWYQASSADAAEEDWTEIGRGINITFAEASIDKYVKFTVLPKNNGPAKKEGSLVTSEIYGPVRDSRNEINLTLGEIPIRVRTDGVFNIPVTFANGSTETNDIKNFFTIKKGAEPVEATFAPQDGKLAVTITGAIAENDVLTLNVDKMGLLAAGYNLTNEASVYTITISNALIFEGYDGGSLGDWTLLNAEKGYLTNNNGAISLIPMGGSSNTLVDVAVLPINGGTGYPFAEGKMFVIETRMKQTNNEKGFCFKVNPSSSGPTMVWSGGFSLFEVKNNVIRPGLSVESNWGTYDSANNITTLDTSDWLDIKIELKGDSTGATQAFGTAYFTDKNGNTASMPFKHAYKPGISAFQSVGFHTPIYDNSNEVLLDYIKISEKASIAGAELVSDSVSASENVELKINAVADLADISEFVDLYNGATVVPSVKTWDAENKKVIIDPDENLNPANSYTVKINKEALSSELGYDYGGDLSFAFEVAYCLATNVTVSGNNIEGSTITGSYTYNSTEEETVSIYKWYKASSADGPWTLIDGLNTKEVTVTAGMTNSFIKFSVTPVCALGSGNEVYSSNVLAPEKAPVVSGLMLDKAMVYLNETFKANYIYSDENGDAESGSEIIWYQAASEAGPWTEIGRGKSITLTDASLVGKSIKFTVLPKNNGAANQVGLLATSGIYTVKEDMVTGSNLLVNPGFEEGNITGWTGTYIGADSGIGIHSADKHSGNYSMLVYDRTAADQKWMQTVSGLEANKEYIIQGYVKALSTPSLEKFEGYVDIADGIENYRPYRSTEYKTVNNNSWTKVSSIFVNTPGVTSTGIGLFTEAIERADDILVDDMYFGELMISDIETYDIAPVRIPESGKTEVEIVKGKMLNQFGTNDGLKDKEIVVSVEDRAGVEVVNNKLVISSDALYGDIVVSVSCAAPRFNKDIVVTLLANSTLAPTATNVVINGEYGAGKTLTVSYDFYQSEGKADTSTYKWFYKDKPSDAKNYIAGATAKTYVLDASYADKIIGCEVTPVAEGIVGYAVDSKLFGLKAPEARNVSITRKNSIYIGSYDYYHPYGLAESGSKYKWIVDGNVVSDKIEYTPNFAGRKTVIFKVTVGCNGDLKYGTEKAVSMDIQGISTSGGSGSAGGGGFAGGGGGGGGAVGGGFAGGVTTIEGMETPEVEIPEDAYPDNGNGEGNTEDEGNGELDDDIWEVYEEYIDGTDLINHWGKEFVENMINRGIMSTDAEGNYNPDKELPRSEMITYLFKAIGLEEAEYTGMFSDVPADAAFAGGLQALVNAGIISVDETFRPKDTISREEMCKILYIALKNAGKITDPAESKLGNFADNGKISDWAKGYVDGIYQAGIMVGVSETEFDPYGTVTKAQAATMLTRILNLMEGGNE